jgi:polyisoprenoid-binding protein YceI
MKNLTIRRIAAAMSGLLVMMFLFSESAAAATAWRASLEHSSLGFAATQNGAPVSGTFPKFTADIHFSPADLASSRVKIVVDLNSLNTSYGDLTATLKSPDWFNMKVFPDAVFKANKFEKTKDNQYIAKGTLTMRGTTIPTNLTFTFEQPTPTTARVKGSTTLMRTAFGVGQGDWSSTKEVRDEVKVYFEVNADKLQK